MSLFTDSSLCLVPSGVKDGKLYSVKPTDGSGDLTFSRGSDIEATRVAANGYIEKAQVNLAIWSEDASNATYSKTNVTVTANSTTAPDGTLSADTLTATGVGGTLQGVVTVNAGSVYSVSVYLKRKTGTGQIGLRGVSNVVTNVTITNEWQRYETYMTAADIYGRYGVYLATSGDEVYCWGFQINYGTIAQTYLPTTTTSVVTGITNDMPRLDYSGGASCPSLLLEPSRQNLLTNDTYYGGSDWSKIGVSPSANNATSPEGVTNAVLLSETAINDQHSLYPTVSVTSGNAYTASCFVKQGTGSAAPQYIGFRFRGGGFTDAGGLVVDLVNKVATYEGGSLTGYKIEDYGNGWLRVSITQSATVTSSSAGLVLFFNNNISGSYSTDYLGNVNADMLVYGMQIEQASHSSSLIPTYGTSATRTGESCSRTGISSLIGQTEGTLYSEFIVNGFANFGTPLCINNGTTSESVWLTTFANGDIRAEVFSSTGGGIQASFTKSGNVVGQTYKIAIGYAANNFAFFVNGTQVGSTDTSGTVPSGMSVIDYDYTNAASFSKSALEIHQSLLFKTRLSNADLATLTTL